MNARLLDSFGLVRGVSHTEFIVRPRRRSSTSSRPRRASAAPTSWTSSKPRPAINLWREWAKIEIAGEHGVYEPPRPRRGYAGIVLSLARQEEPDMSAYDDPGDRDARSRSAITPA